MAETVWGNDSSLEKFTVSPYQGFPVRSINFVRDFHQLHVERSTFACNANLNSNSHKFPRSSIRSILCLNSLAGNFNKLRQHRDRLRFHLSVLLERSPKFAARDWLRWGIDITPVRYMSRWNSIQELNKSSSTGSMLLQLCQPSAMDLASDRSLLQAYSKKSTRFPCNSFRMNCCYRLKS